MVAKTAAIFPVISKRPAMHQLKERGTLALGLKMSKVRAMLDRTPKRMLNPTRAPRAFRRIGEDPEHDVVLKMYDGNIGMIHFRTFQVLNETFLRASSMILLVKKNLFEFCARLYANLRLLYFQVLVMSLRFCKDTVLFKRNSLLVIISRNYSYLLLETFSIHRSVIEMRLLTSIDIKYSDQECGQ